MLHNLRIRFINRQREWEHDFSKEQSKYSKDILMRGNDYSDDE